MDEKETAAIENFKYLLEFALHRRTHLDRLFILAVSAVGILLSIGEKIAAPEFLPVAMFAVIFPVALRTVHTADHHYLAMQICRSYFNADRWKLKELEEVRDAATKKLIWRNFLMHSLAIQFLVLTILILLQAIYLADKHSQSLVMIEGVVASALMLIPIIGLVRLNCPPRGKIYDGAIKSALGTSKPKDTI